MTRAGVLALQGDVREHLRSLAEAGVDAVPVKTLADLESVDGIVIPGGESTTIGRLLGIFGLLEPLRQRIADGMPAYGSCAGMILLARKILDGRPDQRFFGAIDLTVRRNAFGRQVDSFETDLPFAGVGEVHAVFIRAPWVESTGADAEVLARVPDSGGAAAGRVVAVRQGRVLATSFHPELTGDDRVHGLFVDMVKGSRA